MDLRPETLTYVGQFEAQAPGVLVRMTCYQADYDGTLTPTAEIAEIAWLAYNLRDVHPGDGGFGCVPGSHKANVPFPDEWRDLAEFQPFMRAVTGPAGTAIIFTEALTHDAMPWSGAGERSSSNTRPFLFRGLPATTTRTITPTSPRPTAHPRSAECTVSGAQSRAGEEVIPLCAFMAER